MKRILSLLISVVLVISCLPNVASAESIVIENTIAMTDAATVRNGSAHRGVVQSRAQLVTDYSGNTRRFSYIKFDLAPYKDDIDNISELRFSFIPYTPVSDITLELLPDSLEDWSSETLTYDLAESKGMVDIDSVNILCTTDNLTNGTRAYTVDISSAVKEHLSNTSNTVICVKLHSTKGNLSVLNGVGSKEPQLSVKLEVDIDELMQKNYDALTFDKISNDPIDAVASNLNLLKEGTYGTAISWESDSADVDIETGIIKRPRKGEGDKNVKLTALLENTGRTLTKEFDIVLAESNIYPDDLILEEYVYAADSTFVRRGYNTIVNTGDIVCDPKNNDRMGYVKFDFTGYEDILAKANSMQLKIDTKTDANVDNKSDFVAYLLPQELEDIDTATLTYTIAQSAGLVDYRDNILFRQKDVAKVTTYYSDDILGAIKQNIDNGGDSIVWLKFASTTGVGYTVYGSIAGEANKPTLIVKYPKPATELDSRTMTLDRVVNSDMALPAVGEYGSQISWSSSDEALISSTGKVRVDTADEDYTKEDSVVNLTATYTADGLSVTRDFPVRVRRNGVYDVATSATVTSDGSVSDSPTLSVGGTVNRITLLDFDISESKSNINISRKTVLKIYGSEEYSNKSLVLVPINNSDILADGVDNVDYDTLKAIIADENIYKLTSDFENGSYLTFDVTEYLYSLTGDKAIFALCSSNPQIILESESGVLGKEPKLIVSPIEYTDAYAAQVAADDIDLSDITSENPESVRSDLALPTKGRFGSSVIWQSSNEAVVSTDGTVTRGEENTKVTLTAIVTVGSETVQTSFDITVRKAETDLEYAQGLAETLAPEKTILTQSIVLKGENLPDGAVASWESSEIYEAKVNGFNLEITRPNSADLPVTLTVSVTYNGQTARKSFNVTIVRSPAKNIIRNRKITQGDLDAEKAVDENIDTVWEISNSEVVFDFNSAKVIKTITLIPVGAEFSNLKIQMSVNGYQWQDVYSGGNFTADKLNYIDFATVAYGRYIKFVFPSEAEKISFIGAYSFADNSEGDIFADISLPVEAKSDFSLPQSAYGNTITWKSSSNSVVISGNNAKVTCGSSGKNVTLTAEVTVNNETITKSYVVYIPGKSSNGGGGSSSGVGSSFGGGGGLISAQGVSATKPQPENKEDKNEKFSDVSSVPWAVEYINTLAEKGIINGKSSDCFAPNDNLKREEMAKIIVLAFDISLGSDADMFADVDAASWYSAYVAALYENNISKGIGNGNFGVGYEITRQDAFTMLASVMGLDVSSDAPSGFGDDESISPYARGSIIALKELGIVGGDNNGNVNPTAKITRAEIAKVICLAMGK